jgi:predicted metalloprotease with PDZ domain
MHKHLLALLVAAVTLAALPAAAGAATPVTTKSVLTQNGLGSIRIGMRVETARQRTGQQLDVTLFTPGDTSCGIGQLSPSSLGVGFQTAKSHIAVINVSKRGIATKAGIEVGDTAKALKAAYGDKLQSDPNKYTPKAIDYSVTFANKRKLVFYANPKGKIGQISAGRTPEIDFVEGCA